MTPYQKSRAVLRIFKRLQDHTQKLTQFSGLTCLEGCGFCCNKPDIVASPLEFFPFAYYNYKNGHAQKFYELAVNSSETICILFKKPKSDPYSGTCTKYLHRGLICRVFGFAARKNRLGVSELVTCKRIKNETTSSFIKAEKFLAQNSELLIIADYYSELRSIDPYLGNELMPINKAIAQAHAQILQYYQYR